MKHSEKLLSIIGNSRNDSYFEGYKERLEFLINLTLFNLKKLNLHNQIDINIVDWGSEIPLHDVIKIYDKNLEESINFFYVEKKIADENNKYTIGDFFPEMSLNVGIRNAKGKYILEGPSDQFFSCYSIYNLYNFINYSVELSKDKREKIYTLNRRILNNFFLNKKMNFNTFNRFIEEQNFNSEKFGSNRIYSNGGMGAVLATKEQFEKIGGINENLHLRGRFASNDNDIFKRFSKYYSNKVLTSEGIYLLKLPYTAKGLRKKAYKNIDSQLNLFRNFNNYGLPKEKIKDVYVLNELQKSKIESSNWGLKNIKFEYIKPKQSDEIKSKYIDIENVNFEISEISKKQKLYFFSLVKKYIKLASFNLFQNETANDLNKTNIINHLIKNSNTLSYLELRNKCLNRISSISLLNPYISLTTTIESNFYKKLYDCWRYVSSFMNYSHKGYFRMFKSENNDEYIFTEIVQQSYSNIVSINFFNSDEKFKNQIFKNFELNKKFISFIITDKEIDKNLFKNLNFINIYSGDFYIFLNDDLSSDKLSSQLNNIFRQIEKFKNTKFLILKLINHLFKIKTIWLNLKKILKKKIK